MPKIYLLFLFLFCILSANSQIAITKLQIDRANGNLKKEIFDKATIRCLYELRQAVKTNNGDSFEMTDSLTLEIGSRFSYYYDRNKAAGDSVWKSFAKKIEPDIKKIYANASPEKVDGLRNNNGNYEEKSSKGESAKLYKDREKQEAITIDYGGTLYVYKCTEKLPPQQWTITNDTLTWLGYLCQKATASFRGRNYTAWYALEIPVGEGPWKLYGLPGLILKAETDDGIFAFSAVGLEKIHNPTDIFMYKDSYINCNREEIEKVNLKNKTQSRFAYMNGSELYVGDRKTDYVPESLELE